MKVMINRFDGGMANDKWARSGNQASVIKHFDIYTSPNRLIPVRGLVADTTGQEGVGNLLAGSDGKIYGLGTDPANPGNQEIYLKATPTTNWDDITNSLSGFTVDYRVFIEYKNFLYAAHSSRYIGRYTMDGAGGGSTTYLDLTSFTNICNPIVHPKDDIMYIGHDNKISKLNDTTLTTVVLTLPSALKITSLAWYGDYLAIACSPVTAPGVGNAAMRSIVYLWNRDTSITTLTESIDFGTGEIKCLNNLDNVLIAIMHLGGSSANVLDRDKVQLKGYQGGTPFLIKEISTIKETTTTPSVVVNGRVDFIYQGKMYFSVDIVGGSTSPSLYGLWALGRSKLTGEYTLTIERQFSASVLAAAIVGDFTVTVDTAAGTTKTSTNSTNDAVIYATTSSFESIVNQGMPEQDFFSKKSIKAIGINCMPLTSAAEFILKHKADGSSWATVVTKDDSSPDADPTGYTAHTYADGTHFIAGRHHEFQIFSDGGATITGFWYEYEVDDE